MAGFTKYVSVSDGGTFEMPHNGYLIVGANGGTVTVSINMSNTGTDDYTCPETIQAGTAKAIPFKLPQGAVLKFTGANAKLIAYD